MADHSRTVVIYCTHVINDELEYFMNHGYITSDIIDFYFCFNGSFPIAEYTKRANQLGLNNIFFHQRPNVGHDFSGWSEILFQTNPDGVEISQIYDYYIFINSTCMGPFIPLYVKNNWVNVFTSLITDKIKLVGPTINLWHGSPHVQSYMMCTDRIGLQIGLDCGIFNSEGFGQLTKTKLIDQCEIGFSSSILKYGYTIKSLLKSVSNVDMEYYWRTKQLLDTSIHVPTYDTIYNNGYGKISFHPYEVIFFKSNRNISVEVLDTYCKLHSLDSSNVFDRIIHINYNIQVQYGTTNSKIDITKKFNQLFVRQGKIIIPKNVIFNNHFPDVLVGVHKQIFITINSDDTSTTGVKCYTIEEYRDVDIETWI